MAIRCHYYMRATLTITPSLANFGKRGFSFTYLKESEMSEFEKETLSDLAKVIRLQADRPTPPESIWRQIENSLLGAVIMFLATWWLATIIKF